MADRLVVIGQGRLLADTTAAELTSRAPRLEEAFLQLPGDSAQYQASMLIGVLLIGTVGVLTVTSEYTSGTIRATFAAAPRRLRVLAAKAAVVGAVALITGEAAAFLSFFAGCMTLRHGITPPALSQRRRYAAPARRHAGCQPGADSECSPSTQPSPWSWAR